MIDTSRMKLSWLAMAAAPAIIAAMIATPAPAQTAGKNEREFPGQLDSKSPLDDGNPYQVRTLPLEAGKRYAFSADSENFDTKMRLSFADDNDEEIAKDDDSGEGNNAYIEYTPTRSGTYRVRVSAVSDNKGSYVLKVRDLPPLPPLLRPSPDGSSTLVFKHYAGALTQSDGEINGRRIDDYLFHFEGGKRVLISMDREGDDLDPLLQVYPADNRQGTDPIAGDDDGGGKMNAFLTFTPEESGDFIVRASGSTSDHNTGSYRLRVGQQP
jgi:hypothetical protein